MHDAAIIDDYRPAQVAAEGVDRRPPAERLLESLIAAHAKSSPCTEGRMRAAGRDLAQLVDQALQEGRSVEEVENLIHHTADVAQQMIGAREV